MTAYSASLDYDGFGSDISSSPAVQDVEHRPSAVATTSSSTGNRILETPCTSRAAPPVPQSGASTRSSIIGPWRSTACTVAVVTLAHHSLRVDHLTSRRRQLYQVPLPDLEAATSPTRLRCPLIKHSPIYCIIHLPSAAPTDQPCPLTSAHVLLVSHTGRCMPRSSPALHYRTVDFHTQDLLTI